MLHALTAAAGRYGAFIWPAYGLTALVFAAMIVGAVRHSRRWRRRAEDLSRPEDLSQP